MQGPREIRRWVNRLRKRFGKKNGVVSCALFDMPDYEIKAETSKRKYKRSALQVDAPGTGE